MFELTCKRCGAIAMKPRKGREFCSRSCSIAWRHENGVYDAAKAKRGADHPNWKQTLSDYKSMHVRIGRERGKASACALRGSKGCASIKYEWAHIHGTDPWQVENYVSLCKSCHITYDNQRGEGHARSRLTNAQASELRERYAAGGISQDALAAEYGIHQTAISRIIRGLGYAVTA